MWESINNIAQIWWNWQWPMLWQTALLIGIIVVIDLLIRKWAWPQLRYSLWLLVLVKLLLPPGLASSLSVTAPLSQAARQTISISQPAPQPRPIKMEQPESSPVVQTAQPEMTMPSTTPVPLETAPSLPNPPLVDPTPVSMPISWHVYAMGTWLLGVLGLSLALMIRLHGLRREHQRSGNAAPDWFNQELQQAARDLKVTRLPQVVVSDRVCCPAVFGLFRPVLLVPDENLTTMSQTDARHILLHELAHIKRGDLWVHTLHMLLLIAYWPNPLLWLMRKHLQNLRELCCDTTVARHLKEDTPAYRTTLIETAKGLLAQPVDPGLGLLGLFENSSWILTRLQWLEKKTWRYWRLRMTMVGTVVIVMTTCVLPMAQSKASPQEDSTDTETTNIIDLDSSPQNESLVKLLGICDYPVENEDWWNTQGEIIPNGTIAPPQWHIERHNEAGHQYKLFAFQIAEESISDISIAWKMPDSPRSSYFPSYEDRQAGIYHKIQYLLGNFPEDMNFTDVTLGLAVGEWQYAAATSGNAEQEGFSADSITDREVTLHQAQVKDGMVHMSISHLMGQNYSCRIVAKDMAGAIHLPISKSNSGGVLRLCQASFNLPMEDIKYFELQARPYQWIEFKDVPLKPHLKLASNTTDQPNLNTAESTLEQQQEYSNQWNLSTERMKRVGLGTELYFATNGCWPATFKDLTESDYLHSNTPDFINWLHGPFVFLGYQVMGENIIWDKFHITPIAYDQELLDRTGRTPALFANGQVQSVTAKQLAALRSNTSSEKDEQEDSSPKEQSETPEDYAYIMGDVNHTGKFSISSDHPMTLIELIATAGGINPTSGPTNIEIKRTRVLDGRTTETLIQRDLDEIYDGSLPTLYIQSGDIVTINGTQTDLLILAQPEYEWWLKEPTQQIVIDEGDELNICWKIEQELYAAIESFAVGIIPEGVDISENLNYRWLNAGIPSTVRKTTYGQRQSRGVSPFVEELNRAREVDPLTQGIYSIVVFGLRDRKPDWAFTIKHELKCVATAKLIVNASPNSASIEIPQDIPAPVYIVQSGDTIAAIGKKYQIPYQYILQTNKISSPQALRAGQTLSIPIVGPMHAKVYRSLCTMELWASGALLETYKVGLGQDGHATPTGLWRVAQGGKMIRPQWTDAETGRVYQGTEPDYPLGERWIGLKGIEGDAIGRTGFAIHGTHDSKSIGVHSTNGCIRMSNEDVIEVYDLLLEEVSQVEVVD